LGCEDQIGLSIDKPGDLIEIDDDIICAQESFCISGTAEFDDRIYKIIDIDSVINKYNKKSEKADEKC
jgi:hypothetical protein